VSCMKRFIGLDLCRFGTQSSQALDYLSLTSVEACPRILKESGGQSNFMAERLRAVPVYTRTKNTYEYEQQLTLFLRIMGLDRGDD